MMQLPTLPQITVIAIIGNSPDKLCHPRYVAYLVELVLMNKHQISGGGAYIDCYPIIYWKF